MAQFSLCTPDLMPALRLALIRRAIIPRGATWSKLAGGRSNDIWRISWPCAGGGDVAGSFDNYAMICKLFRHRARQNPLFPNSAEDERQMLGHLAETGIAPRFHALVDTPPGLCLIYRHVAGAPWKSGVVEVARLLARLHRRPINGLRLRQIGSGSQALVAQTRRILDQCSRAGAARLMAHRPEGTVVPAKIPVLVHGDPVPGNILVTGRGLVLIDWQCPALADRCEDLALFLSPAMQVLYGAVPLDDLAEREFLVAYGAPDTAERYRRLAPFFHWRMAAYCLWKSEQGDSDYARALKLELAALKPCLALLNR